MEKHHMHTRFLKLAAVSAVALVAAACSDGPELIDRTQPNYVKKSEITQGTWYLQETVVDVPPTSPISFVGLQQEMEKVRFEVQEDYLVAYRSYEFFPGSDPNVDHEKSTIGNTVTVVGFQDQRNADEANGVSGIRSFVVRGLPKAKESVEQAAA